MITSRAVSALLLHHYRRVVVRRAVNYDFAGALRRSPVAATPRHCAWLFATRARRDQPSAGPKKIAKQQAKAREQLAELEQLQRLTVGRVLKIIELSAACMHRGASP